ncbi:MAG: NAD-dependent epimerase/dehydratase family protein [Cytophagales bacterium]
MPTCIIFGGSGYIGTKLAEYVIERKIFSTVYLADIKDSLIENNHGIVFNRIDVRNPIPTSIIKHPIDWVFNFAAIHREPGHLSPEYFETNIKGAENVCSFAEKVGCKNIFFTASISVYGPTLRPTDEYTLTTPNTPYGISKLTAEYIHKNWCNAEKDRKLVVARPGVIYGPGDPGNILRMIKAVKKGYFVLPVTPKIRKSYGYIYGLLESIVFMMNQPEKFATYNYVEKETETLGDLIAIINKELGTNGKIIRFPMVLLKIAASVLHTFFPNINGIHPERVKKVARPTHIIPKVLQEKDFVFNYDFQKSLNHWKSISNADF